MRKFLIRFLLPLLLLLPVAAGGSWLWLRTSLPASSGRLVLDGLGAEVRVVRDAHGIPTITAASDRDAAFALGFIHAQDRLFQMDLMRRLVAGRLAEWLGERALASDRYFRTMGFYRAGERQYALLSPELRGVLDAYAAGVNALLAQRGGALPAEYYLLNATPEPWRPADTLAWGKLMDQRLAGNFRRQLLHARLARRLGADALQILYPPYPKDAPVAVSAAAAAWLKELPLDKIYAQIPDLSGPGFASNNWVVDGKHTVSGKPLLANDPHLGFSAPSVWYLARIETPRLTLSGVTAPGTPFVIIGHNQRIAWGFTTTESAVADLFIERVDPADKTRYLTPDGSAAFATREEKILVSGGEPVTLLVRETRHGPVISDLGGRDADLAEPGTVLALEATFLEGENRSPQAFWGMSRAANWDEFRAALADFVAPQQNVVYADIDGNIGFIAPGRVPIRGKGDGWLPAPGWTGEYDWTGYIPFDRLPAAFNPPSGRIVSANNKIVPESYPFFLSRDWDLPNRAARIDQLLEATPRQSAAASAAIQADTLSLMAEDLLPLMLRIEPRDKSMADALALLRSWDGRMDRNQAAPLLFTAWLRELNRAIFARLGDASDDFTAPSPHPDVIRLILTEHADWCDGRTKTCAEELTASLGRALAALAKRYGAAMEQWRWGDAHEATFTNPFWASLPVLRSVFATALPANGGYDTVDRGAGLYFGEAPYADLHGPTLRMIVDLAEVDAARFMIAPGQSGNVLSPHYADLMRPWRDHAYVTLGPEPGGGALVLVPP